jgi:hypothetical protein
VRGVGAVKIGGIVLPEFYPRVGNVRVEALQLRHREDTTRGRLAARQSKCLNEEGEIAVGMRARW